MKLSIASYAFHGLLAEGKMDVFGYLETCRYRYQLNTADIWNGMLTSTDEDYLRKVRQAMDEKELTLVNLAVDGAHIWDPNPEVRERHYQNAIAHLKAAVILGAKTVRIDMGGRSQEMSAEQFDLVAGRYQEYAKIAADNGYMVGPENHFGPALVPENQKKIYEAVNSPAYGVLLHLSHWDVDEANGDAIAAPMAMHTHVPANAVPMIAEKINLLMDAGYKGYWGIEHHSAKNEYVEVEWQIASVKRALVKLGYALA